MRANKRNTCTVLLGLVNNMDAILAGEATNEAAELLARFRERLLDILESSWSEELQANSHALDDVRERLEQLEAGMAADMDDPHDEAESSWGDDGDAGVPEPASGGQPVGSGTVRHGDSGHGGQRVKRGKHGVVPW